MVQTNDPEREYLARRLREAREYLGLSQDYVSQQTGIPRPAISEIEAGRRRVESLELKRFAALYGRPLSYFLGDENDSDHEVGTSVTAERHRIDVKLRNMTKNLATEDREEILRFAEYLQHKKQASRTSSAARKK